MEIRHPIEVAHPRVFDACFLPVITLLLLVLFVADGRAALLRVSAASAPLMDAPESGAQVIGQVGQGSQLKATGRRSGDWVEVEAPAEVSGWVYGELIREGRIAASSVKVRSGPGIGYVALGTLERGSIVHPKGSRGDWQEIAGMPLMAVWVDRLVVAELAVVDMTVSSRAPEQRSVPVVAPPRPPVPVAPVAQGVVHKKEPLPLSELPSVAAKPSPVVQVQVTERKALQQPSTVTTKLARKNPQSVSAVVHPEPVPKPFSGRLVTQTPEISGRKEGSPVGRRLISGAPQGTLVTVAGVLRPTGFSLSAGAGLRLVQADGRGPVRTVCYVTGPLSELQSRVGQKVWFEGRKYWVKGSREPVVLVQSVRESFER